MIVCDVFQFDFQSEEGALADAARLAQTI